MAGVKVKTTQQSDILHLESEMNNLWGELNTCNIPHSTRMDMESKLSGCEEQFKAVLGGGASFRDLRRISKNVIKRSLLLRFNKRKTKYQRRSLHRVASLLWKTSATS